MANSEFTLRVKVNGANDIAQVERALSSLGATVVRTRANTERIDKTAKDFQNTQAKGIIGTANSTKSFSKLAETIGADGSSGLVGAYATLAANIFAVTAAFNALRNASQVEQIFKGLEAAGVRTGRSLTSTAQALKEVTGSAISTEQAMRSTAQITSAGFDSKAVERLGRAARDTSFALGRNMTDSLDRLSRGIVKLEPELLDELGIMTKIGESNAKYAAQLGKSETQLTNFEKRQGFLNAVLAEAELKFGGLAESAGDTTAYDRLAAKFVDLTNTIFNAINTVAKPIAGLLANSTALLAGSMILFGSTLKNQLIPGLAGSASAAVAAAKEARSLASQQQKNIEVSKALAVAENQRTLAQKANFDFIGTNGPKNYLNLRDAIRSGAASAKDLDAGIVSIGRSIRANEAIIANNKDFAPGTPRGADKLAQVELLKQEQAALINLKNARTNAANLNIEDEKRVIAARTAASVARKNAIAQESAAAALGAASQLSIPTAWAESQKAVVAYSRAQKLAAAEGVVSFAGFRTAAFAAATGVKVIGTAFLTFLPYLGLIALAIGGIQSAYEAMKPDAVKRVEKAFADLNDTLSKSNDIYKELQRINLSSASASERIAQTLTIQSNAVREATAKYEEYVLAQKEASSSSFLDLLRGSRNENEISAWWETVSAKDVLSYNLGLKKNSKELKLAEAINPKDLFGGSNNLSTEATAAIKQLNTLSQTAAPKAYNSAIIARGGIDKFYDSLKGLTDKQLSQAVLQFAKDVDKGFSSVADDVNTAKEAFKALDLAIGEFARSSIQSTAFDAVVKNFDATTDAIKRLQANLDPTVMSQFLSGLGEGSRRVLSADTGSRLTEYMKADAEVQKQINLQKSSSVDFDQQALNIARSTLAENKNLGNIIARELTQRSELFRQAQESERLAKSQSALLQAQISANSRLYAIGGAGRAAQLKDEERVREIQKQGLQIQINVQKALISQANQKIIDLQNEKAKLTLLQEQKKIAIEQYLLDQASNALSAARFAREVAQTRANDPKAVAEAAKQANDANISLREATSLYTSLTKQKEKAANIDSQIAATERSRRDALDSIRDLSNQIAVINQANLTTQQKQAQIIEAQRALNAESLSAIEEVLKKNEELKSTYNEIYGIVNNLTGRLDYQLTIISENARIERDRLQRTFNDRREAILSAKRLAEAELSRKGLSSDLVAAARSGVQAAENNLRIAEEQLNVDNAIITASERKAILEKVIFDTRSQGLDYQKQALDFATKQMEVARQLSDESLKTLDLRRQIDEKRQGYTRSALGQQSLEIESARRSYELAVQESEIKKSLIDLEFALLAAQRDNLSMELTARRGALSSINKDGIFNAQIAQIDATLANIQKIDLGTIVARQKELIETNIRNLRFAMESSIIPSFESAFSKQMSAFKGLAQYLASRTVAMNSAPKPIQVTAAVIDSRSQKTAGQIQAEVKASNPAVSANTDALIRLRETIEQWILKNPTQTVNAARVLSGSARDRTLQAADFVRSQGGNVTELKGRGRVGRHSNNSLHYIGQAFDVNMASGRGEINNPVIAAKMDKLAMDLRAMGANVLWRTARHWDHMHVSFTKGLEASAERVAEHSVSTIQRIETQADNEIVVTARKSPRKFLNNTNSLEMPELTMSLRELPDFSTKSEGLKKFSEDGRAAVTALMLATNDMAESLKELGPEGEIVVAIRDGMASMANSIFTAIDVINTSGSTFTDKFTAVASVAQTALATVQSALAASARAKEQAIDREIAAEQKRDGKSAESVAKIQALEKRKDEIARKQFNTNKKLMMAQAIIATAAGIAQALSLGPILGPIMAGVIGAMGAAQIAIISGTQYQSAASSANNVATQNTPTLTIGKRGDTVDLAKQNNNVGGELGYLRGRQGYGSNSANYSVIGSAYGGQLPRGYGNTGFVVGEKGPEVIEPIVPVSVRPANDNSGQAVHHHNWTIQALDARGVEDLLTDQQGHLISMFRQAANANGTPFLENVNVTEYNRPNKGRKL